MDKREDSSFTRHADSSSSLQSHQSSRQATAADSSITPPPSLALAACTIPAAASGSAAAADSPPAAASPTSVSPSSSPAGASQDHPFASPPTTASPSAAAAAGGSSSSSSSSSPAAGLSPAASRTAAGVVDVSASFAAAAATMHLPSVNSEGSSLGTQSSLLHHPRPPNLLLSETGGVSLLPAAATNFHSFSSSSPVSAISEAALGGAAAAVPSRLTLPPILPPAPWLWDSSLLDAFAASSQQPAAAAAALAVATAAAGGGEAGAAAGAAGAAAAGGRRRSDSSGELLVPVAAAGENPPGPPTAALFLLPTGGGSILRLEEAYVCENCCAIRAPEDLSVEIEAYYCPNCFDSITQTEALACGCSCTKCFDCPRCCASLSVMRQPREAAEAAKGRASEISYVVSRSFSTRTGGVKQDVGGTAAAAATANQAEAVVRWLLFEAGGRTSSSSRRSSGKEGDSEGEGRHHLSEEAGLLAAAAPQRCESLLSLSSDEDDNSDQEEGQQQLTPAAAAERSGVGGKGGSLLALNESSSSSSIAEEDNLDENKRKQQQEQQQREGKREKTHRKEHRYLYYFSCPYCRWNSKALQIISDSSALLPAAAIAEERAGGLLHRYFHQVLDVLQRAARDRERLRQLEARVKHKAVALLFAAAAAHDKRRAHAQLQPARGKSDDADATTTPAAAGGGTAETETGATAAGVGEQLLLSGGGVSGSSKSWRVTDVEQTLAQRAAAQNSFAHAGEAWATAYRSELQQPPQYVGLQQLLRGEHTVQQKQQEEEEEEDTVMTDVMFGWQLQQHEAAQLLKRSRGAAREGPDGETRSRDSALQEHHHLLEGTGERRRKSSIDVTLETPVAIPLHSPQLLLDRASPDSPPLKLPSQRLPGTLLYTKIHPAQASSNSSSNILRSKSENSTTDTGKNTIQEWWTAEQATLEQRLRHPNSLIAAATSTSLLRPTRKKLLTRESKRCRVCARYLVKAHVSSIAVPPFRVNSAAALLLPWIVPRIDRRSGQLSRTGDLADVRLNLLNPTDAPVRLKFHFRHGTSPASAALTGLHLKRHHRREDTSSFIQASQGQEEGDAVARTHSPLVIDDKGGSIKVLSRAAAGAAGGPTGSDVSLSGAAAVKTLDSLAFVTAAEEAGTSLEAEEESSGGLHRRREAATTSRVQSADWETVEIVTPDFELQLDRYDEMLGEFGEYDVISRSSKGSGSHDEDFRSRSASVAAVEWKKGNTAQVRLQVRAKESVSEESEEQQQQQQQPAICCVTIDVETMALQSNTLRVQYLLFLGHLPVPTTEKA